MTKKITWRLKEQPTSESLRELVSAGLLNKEEAREILFSETNETERDAKSLEAEIKFLRELIGKLTDNKKSTIVETIKYIEKPYIQYPWYQPYITWCDTSTKNNNATTGTYNYYSANGADNFAAIVTF